VSFVSAPAIIELLRLRLAEASCGSPTVTLPGFSGFFIGLAGPHGFIIINQVGLSTWFSINIPRCKMAKKKQWGGKRPNSGRPIGQDGPTSVLAVSVPESLANDLDSYAKAKGWSRSKAVTVAIRALIKGKLD
jgi:hypothetical protein